VKSSAVPLSTRRQYRRRPDQFVVAVQLDVDTSGFTYDKWGGEQRCKRGDWLVDNDGDVYTVDQDTFCRTYREVERGRFMKSTPVWAEFAKRVGTVQTNERSTAYEAGDYLVFNEADGGDPYAGSRAKSGRAERFRHPRVAPAGAPRSPPRTPA
jgi:hypothetical protein